MRERVDHQQVPGGGVLGGDGDAGAGDLSWAPPDEAPADPSFEEMWEATADMGVGGDEEDPAGGDDGGIQQSDSQVEDVPALPEAPEYPVAEGDVSRGPGDGAGPDLTVTPDTLSAANILVAELLREKSPQRKLSELGSKPKRSAVKLDLDPPKAKKGQDDMAKEETTPTKSPEHRAKLQASLKKYWAKRRREGARAGNTGGKVKAGTKTKKKAATKTAPAPKDLLSHADGNAVEINRAYTTYYAAIRAAKETLRKAVAEIVEKA